jgi:non-ribosomal peptide synthetase component E (peptide arylation enzyme)
MILGEAETADNRSRGPSLTLDDVFRRHPRRRPDALALIDPLNRTSFTGGSPHRVTYAEADRIVSAMAARLRDMGLPTDTVVGIQLPNIVENYGDACRLAGRNDRRRTALALPPPRCGGRAGPRRR